MKILLDGRPEEALRIHSYILKGGYVGLKKARTMEPAQVIAEIEASGLRGRGGAGFPTGRKLSFIPKQYDGPKYIVCNLDEGEPGTYKDRTLCEKSPHKLIEGIAICAYAISASQAFIYCRTEYSYLLETLKKAIVQAKEENLLEGLEIQLRQGAGAYVCGEESALLESIEGHRGNPRFKPPYPAVKGLWGQPTVVLNVETLCNVPYILREGAPAFASIGVPDYPGTKLIMLNGDVMQRGCFEIETGMSLRDVIEKLGGGVRGGRKIKAIQVGGTSGGFLPASKVDTPLDFASMQKAGGSLGSGSILVFDETRDMADACLKVAEFYEHESCGKCTPCREGCFRSRRILERFRNGTATEQDRENLDVLLDVMKETALCGLGQSLVFPVRSCMTAFPEEFPVRMVKGGEEASC